MTQIRESVGDLSRDIRTLEHTIDLSIQTQGTAEVPRYQASLGVIEDSPFTKVQIRKVIEHPRDENGVLGGSSWESSLLVTFKKNVMPFAEGVANHIHIKYAVPASAYWLDLTSNQRLEAVRLLENGVRADFTLSVAVGHWAARIIMVKAWYRDVVSEMEDRSSVDAPPTPSLTRTESSNSDSEAADPLDITFTSDEEEVEESQAEAPLVIVTGNKMVTAPKEAPKKASKMAARKIPKKIPKKIFKKVSKTAPKAATSRIALRDKCGIA
ncbi:hypothetical protein BJV82DRAFT_665820 [Fennellomyces sp. T-0311]|nr:hypothetical protein BJV82DRAFT_665820 [Fennellomyces sp. T-0311]